MDVDTLANAMSVVVVTLTAIFVMFMTLRIVQSRLLGQEFEEANHLFYCNVCERYMRRWQYDLHKEMHNEKVCVHCGRSIEYRLDDIKIVMKIKPWMKRDRDCKEIKAFEYLGRKRMIKKLRKLRDEEKNMAEYQEYDAKRKPSYWMKKN